MIPRRFGLPTAASHRTVGALAILCALTPPAAGQVVRQPTEAAVEPEDSTDVLGRARRQQARFESRRIQYLPSTFARGGGSCDEIVGRFCTWYDEGDWSPTEEAGEIVELRVELLAYLDSVQGLLPGDGWVLGQRVWYRSEAGRWHDALETARRCGDVEPWWCSALQGFALHGLGRFLEAEDRFDAALEGLDPERAAAWRLPRRAVDGDARNLLEEPGATGADALRMLWLLADPLYLVPGNDRLTEHYARWTVSTLRQDARNPFQIRWARDLEELTIRHGWEVGWERDRPMNPAAGTGVVGHKHPEGRDFLPAGRTLARPFEARGEDFVADRARPRSLYAPAYAPVLLPMEGQVAVFPRGERLAVVATYFVPPDTTWHLRHGHDRPWMEPGPDAGAPDRAGVFLVPTATGSTSRAWRRLGSASGAGTVHAPAGRYVLSVETWSPSRRLAGRQRMGVARDTVPPDVATLSDLLLLREGGGEPRTLTDAADRALLRPEVARGEGFGVVWEVGGLGWRPETVRYRLSVERAGQGFLRRLGERLGVMGRDQPLVLSWEEVGPGTPGPQLRWTDVELATAEPGTYRVRLEVGLAGRGSLRSDAEFTVR